MIEQYRDSDGVESVVANDGSGAEENERVQGFSAENPREVRPPEELPGQAPMEIDEPVHCLICKMLLNGQSQYEDHLKGKRHRKKQRSRCRGNRALSSSNDDDDEDQAPSEQNNDFNGKRRKQKKKCPRMEEQSEL